MTIDQAIDGAAVSPEAIQEALLGFLEGRTKSTLSPTQDLFASGLLSSMFAMELVVHLEQSYRIAIVGADLKLDNFRTVQGMTDLVLRLQGGSTAGSDV
ncbi:acyl carrier protein [Streptomyces sp. NPDC098789]|uniref:acyl carrier protein n=1 Tax=Streptomyces sp. NPDC098789 TaxID=3366098 RepID=UPI0037F63674